LTTNINSIIENCIQLDKSSIWVLANAKQFNYSDGIASERYLEKVFSRAKDLSSNSFELEKWIKDWPSEYHLSRKRAQLLRGFEFDRTKKVLEVGCGCGAMTRFLGETFDSVVSIEGSFARARLARLRTIDMDNVSILCAPFQDIKFKERFDIVFCIGVFEYSGSFVNAIEPYDVILDYFHNILHPDGVLVLAIENQFGLKYFSSSKEDHTNVMFDGLEGYPHDPKKARTFGYDDLQAKMSKYFSNINFYYPYPDYKIPSCVLSERFLTIVKAGELVGQFVSRDYSTDTKPLFDEKLVCLELDKNGKLPFFSNSFLVLAGKQDIQSIKSQALGVLYNTNRNRYFQTITKFIENDDGSIWASKKPLSGNQKIESRMLTLHPVVTKWHAGLSLQTIIAKRVKEKNITIDELFAPCRIWLSSLTKLASIADNTLWIDGRNVDCIWKNAYIRDNNCMFIDQEWEWYAKIKINVLVIRSIYWFLRDISGIRDLNGKLKKRSMVSLIKEIAKTIGVATDETDFKEFLKLESEISRIISGLGPLRFWLHVKLPMRHKTIYVLFIRSRNVARKIISYTKIIINYFSINSYKFVHLILYKE
jgi:SAM-dependent methyltransferase